MFLSIFDICKIGIGPSSSHTMGPMVAAGKFLNQLLKYNIKAESLSASLHGSLAFTGKGHHTDYATIMGLIGFKPETFDSNKAQLALDELAKTGKASVKSGINSDWVHSLNNIQKLSEFIKKINIL